MEIFAKLKEDLKTYMRAKDMLSLNVVRGVLNEISVREMKNIEITSDEILKVLRAEVKKRKEAIETFSKAAREELVKKENFELKILQNYLPAEMSDEELTEKIKAIAIATADKTFGPLVKTVLAELKGIADGKRVSEILKKILG